MNECRTTPQMHYFRTSRIECSVAKYGAKEGDAEAESIAVLPSKGMPLCEQKAKVEPQMSERSGWEGSQLHVNDLRKVAG